MPELKIPGLTATRTLPFGRIEAGPSAESRLFGKVGPAVQTPVDEMYTAVLGVAPTAKTVPSGRRTAGPISCEPLPSAKRSGSLTIVLPALDQTPVAGLKSSEFVRLAVLLQSIVRTLPFGSRFQPSSSWRPVLPVPGRIVQVRVEAFNKAVWDVMILASMNVPSARTTLCASPMRVQPVGGIIEVQELVVGL